MMKKVLLILVFLLTSCAEDSSIMTDKQSVTYYIRIIEKVEKPVFEFLKSGTNKRSEGTGQCQISVINKEDNTVMWLALNIYFIDKNPVEYGYQNVKNCINECKGLNKIDYEECYYSTFNCPKVTPLTKGKKYIIESGCGWCYAEPLEFSVE